MAKARMKNQSSITIHIDTRNELPTTLLELFNKVRESDTYLSARTISATSKRSFVSTFAQVQNIDEYINGFSRGISLLRIEKLERVWDEKNYPYAETLIKEIIEDRTSSLEAKFVAYHFWEILELLKLEQENKQHESPKIKIRFANERKIMSKEGPFHLRSFAIFTFLMLLSISYKVFSLINGSSIVFALITAQLRRLEIEL